MTRIIFVTAFTFLIIAPAFAMGSYRGESAGEAPSMLIAAPASKVQQVIISRAAAKGSIIKGSGGRLVLERPLTSTTREVEAACGSSLFGRKVRVVITLQAVQGGTQVSERRYITGGGPLSGGDCAMPLSSADYAQSINTMNEVKTQAEAGNALAPVTKAVPAR